MQEAEIGRIRVPVQPGHKVRPYIKTNQLKKGCWSSSSSRVSAQHAEDYYKERRKKL
jgi:hypothetical protein